MDQPPNASTPRRPRGLELLLERATADPVFRDNLIRHRAQAAHDAGVALNPSEVAILEHVPFEQIHALVRAMPSRVQPRSSRLRQVASVMLAALAAPSPGCKDAPPPVSSDARDAGSPVVPPRRVAIGGVRPDMPVPRATGTDQDWTLPEEDAEVESPVPITPGRERLPSALGDSPEIPPPVPHGPSPVVGVSIVEYSSAPGNVNRVVAGMRAGLRRCYKQGLVDHPKMKGSVRVKVEVDLTGAVRRTEVLQREGIIEAVASCMAHRIEGAQFDPPAREPSFFVIHTSLTTTSPP